MNDPQQEAIENSSIDSPRSESSFSWKRILMTVGIIASLGGLGWYVRVAGIGTATEKPVFPAHGEVYFNDEPLSHGHIEARPIDNENAPDRIIGPINDDGTFELYTDYNGTLRDGVPTGSYKLLLMVYHPTRPLEAPAPLLPAEYYDESRTPLMITVTSDPEKNHFVLRRMGEFQAKPDNQRNRPREESREQEETTDADPILEEVPVSHE